LISEAPPPAQSYKKYIIIIGTVAVIGVLALMFLPSLLAPKEHNIIMGRATVFTGMVGYEITSQIVFMEGVKGKFPVGQQMILSFPVVCTSGFRELTSFYVATPGFHFNHADPALPKTIWGPKSIMIDIYIDTPTEAYTGILDFTVVFTIGFFS